MPVESVRGVRLNYEIVGDAGLFIALTPGSRRPYAELADLAGSIARFGYRVLLHDRRNCGASEIAFDGTGSEHEVWADDLYLLAKQLGALPLYVGGSSAGARLAILFALRHPEATRGLLLWRVTGGQEAVDTLAHKYYGQFIPIAQTGGMEAICGAEHFSDCIAANPANRERLLRTDPEEFVRVMTHWRERFLASAGTPVVGATEADLQSIAVPVCVISGNDRIHTPATALAAARLIPNAEFHDDVVEKRSDGDLLPAWDQNEWRAQEPRIAEIFAAFLSRVGKTAVPA